MRRRNFGLLAMALLLALKPKASATTLAALLQDSQLDKVAIDVCHAVAALRRSADVLREAMAALNLL